MIIINEDIERVEEFVKKYYHLLSTKESNFIDFSDLMQIVSIIELLNNEVIIYGKRCAIHKENRHIYLNPIVNEKGDSKIEAVYKAIVTFIKKYNDTGMD